MNEETKKRIIECCDRIFNFNIFNSLANLLYGTFFSILFCLVFIGIKESLVSGFFELMVSAVIFFFCIKEADKYFSRNVNIFLIIGIGIFLHFVLVMAGYNTDILTAMVSISVFISILKILYEVGLRKYMINKLNIKNRSKQNESKRINKNTIKNKFRIRSIF